jgi:hypothetical protein
MYNRGKKMEEKARFGPTIKGKIERKYWMTPESGGDEEAESVYASTRGGYSRHVPFEGRSTPLFAVSLREAVEPN